MEEMISKLQTLTAKDKKYIDELKIKIKIQKVEIEN